MTSTIPAFLPGLRQRKKARTREQIREHALRLFLEQGYESTTVQQIAAAAEVSPSTVFRYFPTKARLVMSVDLDTLIHDAFAAQRPGDTVFDAIHAALRASFAELSALASEADPGDGMVIGTLARARDALLGQAAGVVGLLAELIAGQWGREPHDPLVQAAAGGVVGVGVAAWSADRDLNRATALRILATGMQGLEDGFRP